MTNEKKLELTLCGMFSYKLQIFSDDKIWTLDKLDRPYRTNDKIFLNIGCRYDEKGFPLTQKSFILGQHEAKPLLHSLSKINEPILEGGLIPIVELEKLIDEFGNANPTITMVKTFAGIHFQWYAGNQKVISRSVPFAFYEKLKEWHFNIYDLPKEMYIEKSTVNLNLE